MSRRSRAAANPQRCPATQNTTGLLTNPLQPLQASALNSALLRELGNSSQSLAGASGAVSVSGNFDAADFADSPATQPSSWEQWLAHFDTMDELAEDAAHYQVGLCSAPALVACLEVCDLTESYPRRHVA